MLNLTIYNKLKQEVEEELIIIKDYLKSSSPLEARWEVFKKVYKDLPVGSCYFNLHIPDYEELTYYDDLYCDRYQTISFPEIIERLSDDYRDKPVPEDKLNILKERMLQSGDGSCISDW